MRDNIETIVALSPMQEGMLFHTLAAGDDGMYIQQLALRVTGDLDVGAFELAWADVVARHQALRSAFVWESAERPLQVVFRDAPSNTRHEDWSGEPEEARAARWQALLAADREQSFTLRRPPLVRLTFVRMGRRDYRFVLTYHHILLDGWSGSIVFKELLQLYEARIQGRRVDLPPAPRLGVYADWAGRQTLAQAERFFRNYLAGFRAPTPLFQDRRALRGAAGDRGFVAKDLFLPAPATARLNELAKAHRLTFSTVIQGAWAAMLSRHSGENDVLFGAISSGRPADLPGVDRLVGMFVNTLPVRVRVEPGEKVGPWLQRLQRELAEVRQFEHVPLVKVHPWSDVAPGRPLFETCQVWENVAVDVLRPFKVANLEFVAEQSHARTSDPITFMAFPGAELKLQLIIDKARISPETADLLLGHLATWLGALPDAVDRPVAEVPMLTRDEEARLSIHGAGPERPAPAASVHGLFSDQARATPDAPAVEDDQTAYTYRQLDERANRIARALRSLGVGRGAHVGLCLRRSVDMVAAVLGVMKANAAYVPLDPAYPTARLRFMIEDAQVAAIISEEGCLDATAAQGARVLWLDGDRALLDAQDGSALPDRSDPGEVAYVLYTSGSTGVPKGVQVTRGALVNLLLWAAEAPLVERGDVVLATTSLSFDIAEVELLLPLLLGARIIVAPQPTTVDATALRELLAETRATVMQGTPASWRMLLAAQWVPTPGLKILTAGEALNIDLARQLCAAGGPVWNLYGPTETTIYSTAWLVDPSAPESLIGRPVANTQVYVVDAAGQKVPEGVAGELLIGGAGLALGYLNRPELTAERFVASAAAGGARVYRTGDLARFRADGQLDYLGRLDHQVKIRGNRVELGEIEAALNAEPTVRHAAATVVEDASGEQSIVAYVVAEGASSLDGAGGGDLDGDHVSDWQRAWDDTYAGQAGPTPDEDAGHVDPAFNTRGWISSYDGRPIPRDQMREWLDTTVARIGALGPRKVLEIGCGTGMLLFGLADRCERYIGADFSAKALRAVGDHLSAVLGDVTAGRVSLVRTEAGDLSGVADGSVDTVVLNSVVQYLPSVGNLVAVLEQAAQKLAPGGQIFLGDVRDRALHAAFWTSVHLHRAAPQSPAGALRDELDRSFAHEKELLLDRTLFAALAERLPRLTSARLLLKRGRAESEMVRFRYDVVLRFDEAEGGGAAATREVDWDGAALDPARLDEILADVGAGGVVVRGIPNRRTAGFVEAARLLREGRVAGTREDLEREAAARSAKAIDPEELWARLDARGLAVELAPSLTGGAECFDAIVTRPLRVVPAPRPSPAMTRAPAQGPAGRSWDDYGNNPLQVRLEAALGPRLRHALSEKLPSYMMPSSLIFLDALPLTPNGKVDRRALRPPGGVVASRPRAEVLPPRDSLELTLVRIWEDVLGVAPIGVNDDFFERGGHSIMSVRLIAQIEKRLGRRLPLSAVLEARTVDALARHLRATPASAQADQVLVCVQPGGQGSKERPLFCVHPAGGGVLCYRELARELGPNYPVYAFEAAVDAEGTIRDRTVPEMAIAYLRSMRKVQPKGPYRLAGWSLGGLVAAEMAETLRREGEEVEFVGLLDTVVRPPGVMPQFVFDGPRRMGFARYIEEYYGRPINASAEKLATLEGDELVAYLAERMQTAGVLPPDVDLARGRAMFAVYADHTKAYYEHVPSRFTTRLTLLRAQTPLARDMVHPDMPTATRTLGWSEYCATPVTVIDVPGDHMTLLTAGPVRELAEQVRVALRESAGAGAA